MEENTTIFGIRTVIEAIQSGKNIDKIYLQKELSGPLFKELQHLASKKDINFSYVPVEKLNKLTSGNHQGAVAKISPVEFRNFEELVEEILEDPAKIPMFLLLDQITDARNFGAIIRTAECSGVHGIIIQNKGGAPVNADTIKTSAGAVFKIPICKVNHIKDAVYFMQSSGINVVAATEKTQSTLYDTNFKLPTALVMGSEDRGVNPSVLKIVDEKAKLPMFGTIASLNVSVACGAFLYEIVRQRI
jgi:23S rRNA (guanosine2251-2'-O)-methyltransferase